MRELFLSKSLSRMHTTGTCKWTWSLNCVAIRPEDRTSKSDALLTGPLVMETGAAHHDRPWRAIDSVTLNQTNCPTTSKFGLYDPRDHILVFHIHSIRNEFCFDELFKKKTRSLVFWTRGQIVSMTQNRNRKQVACLEQCLVAMRGPWSALWSAVGTHGENLFQPTPQKSHS